MLLIGLQGYRIDGNAWAKRAQIEADIAEPLGLTFVLLDAARKNWPACRLVGDEKFDRWSQAVSDLCCGLGEQCFLIGHSDGATMALRLAVDKRLAEFVEGVVSYAGVFDHFMRGMGRQIAGDLPPALFLNNDEDGLVDRDNARELALHWTLHGPGLLQIVPARQPPKHTGCGHAWDPDAANRLIGEWIHESMGAEQKARNTHYH